MAFAYTHRPLGDTWPGARTTARKRARFGENWGSTLQLLGRELRHLGARDVVLAVDVQPRDIRIDGGVRADARIRNPAVILECRVGPDLLQFPCDRYDYWQHNVRAIALALEALRAVDRHGVRPGRQYEGFKALPGAGGSTSTLTAQQAAAILRDAGARYSESDLLGSVVAARDGLRFAQATTHPDRHGGSTTAFQRVQDARQVLSAHHGVAL